jgi:hypothetical protein
MTALFELAMMAELHMLCVRYQEPCFPACPFCEAQRLDIDDLGSDHKRGDVILAAVLRV